MALLRLLGGSPPDGDLLLVPLFAADHPAEERRGLVGLQVADVVQQVLEPQDQRRVRRGVPFGGVQPGEPADDERLEGAEYEAVKRALAKAMGVDEVPPVLAARLEWFQPAEFELEIEAPIDEETEPFSVTVVEREQMQEILDLIAQDELDEALERLEDDRNEASSAVFDFTLANIHFQEDRLEPAAGAYRAAVDKFPRFRRAWRNRHEVAANRRTRCHVAARGDRAASNSIIAR